MKINLGELTIVSPAFDHGTAIPVQYTGDGDGVSPPLEWSSVPEGTKSFALVAHDPDAPLVTGFTHWVLYGIPASATSLPEDVGEQYVQGVNGMGQPGWVPPSPPPGHGDHFYFFHLYALDSEADDIEEGLDSATLLGRIDEHILEQARIVGVYRRA
jgi:Raf kinase inhibitor-like YbhB/YbcL family protein